MVGYKHCLKHLEDGGTRGDRPSLGKVVVFEIESGQKVFETGGYLFDVTRDGKFFGMATWNQIELFDGLTFQTKNKYPGIGSLGLLKPNLTAALGCRTIGTVDGVESRVVERSFGWLPVPVYYPSRPESMSVVGYTSNDQLVVTISDVGRIRFWDVHQHVEVESISPIPIQPRGSYFKTRLSENGETLVVQCGTSLRIFEVSKLLPQKAN